MTTATPFLAAAADAKLEDDVVAVGRESGLSSL